MRFFRSLFDSKHLGEETIKAQIKAYQKYRNMLPEAEPHIILAEVWLSRAIARGLDGNDEMVKQAAFTETFIFSCVEYPDNVIALGIYILKQERGDIIEKYPDFLHKFNAIMGPVFSAQQGDNIMKLYKKYNPKLANET